MPKNKYHKKGGSAAKPPPTALRCSTLEDDEETRCDKPLDPDQERCALHRGQYRKMYEKYKNASKKVDELVTGNGGAKVTLPTKNEIMAYTDSHQALLKARWVREYVEAIRLEKKGREIHSKRFFLKIDDGHKIRLKVLAKQMISAVEALDGLQARAFDLRVEKDHPSSAHWIKAFQASSPTSLASRPGTVNKELLSTSEAIEGVPTGTRRVSNNAAAKRAENDDDDLIEIELRRQKQALLSVFELFYDEETVLRFYDPGGQGNPDTKHFSNILHLVLAQYARRIIFHDPALSMKAYDKVSFKDMILDNDFSHEDAWKFFVLFQKRMGIGLLWMKDAVIEALHMSPSPGKTTNAANIGKLEDRLPMLGGWIYNQRHSQKMTNQGWWTLLQFLEPEANTENRFIRLCNDFDDIHSFLSFGALGMMPPPKFCSNTDPNLDMCAMRAHLSLSGIIITDMISPISRLAGPIPTAKPARRRGCKTWGEIESRAYMFGAIRNEHDPITAAFLAELRAQPEMFCVVTRSETDPSRKVESFGGPEGEILYQVRSRTFEAPFTLGRQPSGQGNWDVARSAVDVLYGTGMLPGYLTTIERGNSVGWFFHFKRDRFSVKYILILDPTPNRHIHHLTQQVAWAALRAQGLGEGQYNLLKYARASDKLFDKHAAERLAWMPKGYGNWSTTSMAEQMGSVGIS